MVVALTVVALGTSLPELVVAIQAALSNYPGILLGNVVGSNIANVLLVGGVSAAIYPLTCGEPSVRRDSALMTVVSLLVVLLCLFGRLDRPAGATLLVGLVAVLSFTVRDAGRAHRKTGSRIPLEWALGLPTHGGFILLFITIGLVFLPMGADLVVNAAVEISDHLGVAQTVVGLSIIAFSTSLPELATTVVAALQKRTEMVVGTIVGSNIFNLLAIMGIAALVSPAAIPVPSAFSVLDFPVMLVAAVALTASVWVRGYIGRTTGAILTVGYVAYLVALFS
jgi:cation:H+ antiporter